MVEAANNLEFEKAALLRDQIRELKSRLGGAEMKNPGVGARARADAAAASGRTSYGKGRRKR